eukprot:7380514-Prymnesium_polylepis.1
MEEAGEAAEAMEVEADNDAHGTVLARAIEAYKQAAAAVKEASDDHQMAVLVFDSASKELDARLGKKQPKGEVAQRAHKKMLESKQRALDEALTAQEAAGGALDEKRASLRQVLVVLNEEDTKRRAQPDKWRQLHTHGATELMLDDVPTATDVYAPTHFEGIFNDSSKQRKLKLKPGEGGRYHGRAAVADKKAAAPWVEAFPEPLGALGWLATTTGGDRAPCDAHALLAGVDDERNDAPTPAQTPHADTCDPHSQEDLPWGDRDIVMLVALQDDTTFHYYPLDGQGEP